MRSRAKYAVVAFFCVCASTRVVAGSLPEGVSFGFGFENGALESAGPYQFRNYVLFENQFGKSERLQIETTNSSDFEELNGLKVDYTQPFGGFWELQLAGSGNVTRPGGIISRFFDSRSEDRSLSATLNRSAVHTGKLDVILGAGVSMLDVETRRIATTSLLQSQIFEQRTRDVSGSIQVGYNPTENRGIVGVFQINQGIDWLDPRNARANSTTTPTILNYSASFTQNLPKQFQFVVNGAGQWTDDRVNGQKTFSAGGWDYGAAYPGGEINGDTGAGIRIELNYLNAFRLGGGNLLYYQPFIFADYAYSEVNDPVAGDVVGTQEIGSAGLGLSVESTGGIQASVQVGFPLSGDTIFDNEDNTDPRILFTVGLKR